jgi:hypothetical protein
MSRFFTFLIVSALALATLACSITFNLPVDRIVTGPTQTEEILIEPPAADETDLTLDFGAGNLEIEPGDEGYLVSGTAAFNVPELKPEIDVDNDRVHLSTGDLEINGIPSFGDDLENKWDLKLGDYPMILAINAGAYKGELELGGLSIKSLDITDGAAEVRLSFAEPNKVEMERLRYQTGASNVELSGLANANFSEMVFRSGAGEYRLDFSGDLKRNAVVTIESGFSQVTIVVPEGISAKVITTGGLVNVEAGGDWGKEGSTYSLSGGGPELTINVDMGVGNLVLRTS